MDLSFGPFLLLFGYGGSFRGVWVIRRGVNDVGDIVGQHL